jgi:syntaxin 1B/2/3
MYADQKPKLRTNRTGHASSVLGNVRARHNELQQIEQTLSELALLYQELATVVEQQDPVIAAAEDNAIKTTENLDKGNQEVKTATDHARRRRKLKWWCALVVLLIVLAVALGVGLGVSLAKN